MTHLRGEEAQVATLDASGLIIVTNEAWTRGLGVVPPSRPGRSYLDLLGSSDEAPRVLWDLRDRVREGVRRVLAGEESAFRLEYDCAVDGQTRVFLLQANALLGGGATLYHADITERREADAARRQAEEAVRRERDFSEWLIDSSVDAIVAFDRQCRFTVWNGAMERFTGLPRGSALGRHAFDLFPFLVDGGDDQYFAQALAGVSVVARDRPFVLPSGRRGFFEGHYAPLRGSDGEVVGGLVILRDTTERLSLEAQLRESQKMEAVGRLAGGVAHDFNNLLTAIIGYGQLLQKDLPPTGAGREASEQVLKAADRAAALTRQLLAFSRRQMLQPRVLDVNAVLTGVHSLLRRLIGEDIKLESVADPAVGAVKADPGQLEQVVLNLAVNARDAMPRGGRLRVETGTARLAEDDPLRARLDLRPGDYVTIAVSDDGCGMDAATRERIFEPFFTTKSRGTGLGLATVYGIVRQSGGGILVDSEPDEGATFRVFLPQVPADAAAAATSAPSGPPLVEDGSAGAARTILLVEDEAEIRALVRITLQKFGYTVLEAQEAGEALRLAARHTGPIDLLLTDVIMPGRSGPELARELSVLRPRTRVLYMSGYTDDALGPHGLLSDDTAFLQKPFTRETLARKVQEALAG